MSHGCVPQPKAHYALLLSHISWPLIPCFTHSPFALQPLGTPNHGVSATDSGHTKTSCPYSYTRSTACTKPLAHTQLINCNIISKRSPQLLIWLNHQVLVLFFPFANLPIMPHYPALTDSYYPQHGRLSFSLHFMTSIFFGLPSPNPTSFINHMAGLIPYAPPPFHIQLAKC